MKWENFAGIFAYIPKETIPITIATISLLIAVISAYYTYFQKGKFKILPPMLYMPGTTPGTNEESRGNSMIALPLTFVNEGARLSSVSNIAIIINGPKDKQIFDLQSELDSIPPTRKPRMAGQFAVKGRESMSRMFGFASRSPEYRLELGKNTAEIWAKINDKNWEKYLKFIIDIDKETIDIIVRGDASIYNGLDKIDNKREE